MVVYAALLVLSIHVIREQSPQGLVVYALAISPSLPIGGTIWQVLRYMDRSDEYVRAIVTRRFVLATGVTLFLCTAWGFLESNAGLPMWICTWSTPCFGEVLVSSAHLCGKPHETGFKTTAQSCEADPSRPG
jgi:hypothetical protein